ncbi:MAG: MFS transporter [Saprospiraceae bacterium]|nr:MFS transporter [Saprospiraceae bacterium]
MVTSPRPLYTTPFLLLCLSNVLFSGSFNMIIPELPNFLTELGGADYKGLIISVFTLSAGLSRPFSGKLADTVGRIPLMIFGTLVCVVCSLLYPILTTVAGFVLLRFLHGFSTGFKPTAATAFAADIVPIDRRGEAMGIMGVSMNLGASLFPPLGSYLVLEFSVNVMFYVSSIIALISIGMLMGLKETLLNTQRFRPKLLKLSSNEIIERKALPVALVTAFIYLTFGILLTISPDQADFVGLTNKGMLFTSFTVFTILSRATAGRVSDRYGRVSVIKISIVFLVLSLIFMGQVSNVTELMIAAGALGFSTGIAAPAVFAWVIDISPEDRRGRYMATVFIALEIGIGFGALFSAWVYDNNPAFFARAYYAAATLTLIPGIYLQFFWKGNTSHKT